MESVALLLAALAAGAGQGVTDQASQAVADAYGKLKQLLSSKLTDVGDSAGAVALERYEQRPDTWQAPLREALVASDAAADPHVADALDKLSGALSRVGLSVTAAGNANLVQGDVNIHAAHNAAAAFVMGDVDLRQTLQQTSPAQEPSRPTPS